MAVDQLVRTQLPSGLFPYDYDFATGAAEDMSDISGLNIVRQGGVLFALVQYLEVTDSQRLRETVAKTLQAFADRSLPVGKGKVQSVLEDMGAYNRWQFWGILRAPLDFVGLLYAAKGKGALVSANGSYERAWPGATALALTSELIYRNLTGDEKFADMRQRWLHGLLALRVPQRGFREAPHYLDESGYVNGEAWLALTEYSRAFPRDGSVATTLSELDDYLIRRYSTAPSLQFYHWGAMAAALRLQMTGDPRFSRFIRDQTDWFLAKRASVREEPDNTCASVEGLATAYRVLRVGTLNEEDPLMVRIRSRVELTMTHNRRLQIWSGQESFMLDDGVEIRSPRFPLYAGAFLMSSKGAKIQVDVTAHCLSALIRMQNAGLARQVAAPVASNR